MLRTLAIAGFRSVRALVVPFGPLTVVTGPNGAGKSNLYRALRLLQDNAHGVGVASLAREGGFGSVLWAGPPGPPRHRGKPDPVALRVGFAGDDYGYSLELGKPPQDPDDPSLFRGDPQIKRESIWVGETWRSGAALVDRQGALVRARGDGGWQELNVNLLTSDSMLTEVADPHRAAPALILRDRLRGWRFYDGFRSDADAPARQAPIGTRTPVLANDGRDLGPALQTIREIGDERALDRTIDDAFPGGRVEVDDAGGRMGVAFHQPGLHRPLSQAELSDGTLRYLLWTAALLTARPPNLMVLNEPETSLHPDLLPALGRLIVAASAACQLWVITHSPVLRAELERAPDCLTLELEKVLGATSVVGQRLTTAPPWAWPPR